MKIGNKLKQLRKSQSLSLKNLSELTGISVSFLSDIENERSNPSVDSLITIAEKLGIPVTCFFDEDFSSSLRQAELSPVLSLLEDFSSWSKSDKEELLHYLRAKQIIRNNKE